MRPGIMHPDWSPDGTEIAFSSTRRSQRFPDIYVLDLSLGTEEEGNMPLQLTAEDKLEISIRLGARTGLGLCIYRMSWGAEHGTIYAVDVDGRFSCSGDSGQRLPFSSVATLTVFPRSECSELLSAVTSSHL